MRIAAAQIDIQLTEVEANLAKILRWIELAGSEKVDLVVFPECALTGYCYESREEAFPFSRTLTDPLWQSVATALATHQVTAATLGFLERDGERLFNASALVTSAGVVGSYRKVHLPHLGVDRFVDPGDRPYAVHQAGEMRIGMAICYDSSFPEPMRVLGLEGADIIALGTNWPDAAKRTAHIVPPARSMENHLYFIAANRVGRERAFSFCGLSSICGPDGIEFARAGELDEQLITASVDLKVARNKRIERTKGSHVIDRFADRRPQFYGPVVAEVARNQSLD